MADPHATPDRAATLCYHRRRHASQEFAGTQVWTKVRCPDCGAEVSAAYNVPLPELVPMPMPEATDD